MQALETEQDSRRYPGEEERLLDAGHSQYHWSHNRSLSSWLSWRALPGEASNPMLLALFVACLAFTIAITYLITLTGSSFPSSSSDADALCKWSSLYLPEVVVPVRYDHNLSASFNQDFDPLGFPHANARGQTGIRVRVSQNTRCVVLHVSKNLDISSVSLVLPDRVVSGHVYSFNIDLQLVILMFDTPVPATQPGPLVGQVELRPKVNGPLGDPEEHLLPQLIIHYSYAIQPGLDGFYASEFFDSEGQRHFILSTQFESLAARKAFPCFDEPRFKARFAVVISAPAPPFVVLSNMPVMDTRQCSNGLVEYAFQVSPPMSTYLLAWVIGELESVGNICATDFGPVPLNVWSTPDKVNKLGTALAVGCKALQTFSSTFGPYALPKLDLVGIPDFAAGAMENWGVITFRETSLLLDTFVVPNDVHQDFHVATVVSHEILHQWFGNLVTCADWSELWLNEGFAMYFENLAASVYHPGYGYFPKFFAQESVPAFKEDAIGSHPLSGTPSHNAAYSRVKSMAQVESQFDGIEYEKGAAVIRMLRSYLAAFWEQEEQMTNDLRSQPLRRHRRALEEQEQQQPKNMTLQHEEPFLVGLRLYISRHAYSVATNEMLWDALAEATGQPVQVWMHTWTLRKGYPVVQVDFRSEAYGLKELQLRQWPMGALDIPMPEGEERGQLLWWLPVAHTTSRSAGSMAWSTLVGHSTTVQLPQISNPTSPVPWVLVNVGRYGFYRVNYTEQMWAALANASALPEMISAVDYAGLLSDAYQLSEAGHLNVMPLLQLLRSLASREMVEFSPWSIALDFISHIRMMLSVAAADEAWTKCLARWDAFTLQLTSPFLSRLDKKASSSFFKVADGDGIDLRLLRPSLLLCSSRAGNKDITQAAVELLASSLQGSGEALGVLGQIQQSLLLGSIHPDVRGAVYAIAAMSGDTLLFRQLFDLYIAATAPEERERLLEALSWGDSATSVQQLLTFLLTDKIKLQDTGSLLQMLGSQSGPSFRAVWDFILSDEHFSVLVQRFTENGGSAAYSLGNPVRNLLSNFVETSRMKDLVSFAAKYDGILMDASDFLEEAQEHIAANQHFMQILAPTICTWLEAQ